VVFLVLGALLIALAVHRAHSRAAGSAPARQGPPPGSASASGHGPPAASDKH
jgi:hypothetical protein